MAGKRCIIEMPSARKKLVAALAVLFLAAILCLLLLPESSGGEKRSEALEKAAEGLNAYDVTLRLDAEKNTLAISQTVDFTNQTGDTLSTLVVRTWLNAYQSEEYSPAALEEIYDASYPEGFSPGYLTLYDVKWNGEMAAYTYLDEAMTALEIQIPQLAQGESGLLEIRSVGVIPVCSHRLGKAGDAYQLGNVIPLLSVYENGAWHAEEYAPIGDPFISECANFTITLHAPEGFIPACSAPLEKGSDGAWRGEILAARDIGLSISPDYALAEGKLGDISLYSYAPTEAGAKRALAYARQALQTFSSLYGEYPWPAFTVCSVDFSFGGMEYPALCMVGDGYYLESRKDSLELVIVHEAAHQWFYAMAGSDQFHHPWQDEALCEYAALRYVQKRYGQGSYENLKYLWVDEPMQEQIPGMLTPGSPVDYFGSYGDYSSVVYGRGAALLLALDEMLPKGVDDFLKAYASEFAFRYASRADFQEFLNAYAGMDLSPLLIDYLDTAF